MIEFWNWNTDLWTNYDSTVGGRTTTLGRGTDNVFCFTTLRD